MRQTVILSAICFILVAGQVGAQQVRGAFPSPSLQILPMMVAAERGFYEREGLELELVFVRGATTAVQALLANQIQFIFSIGPQMPAVWEGNDIMLLAQQAVAGHRVEHETQKETCRIHGSPFSQRSDGRIRAEIVSDSPLIGLSSERRSQPAPVAARGLHCDRNFLRCKCSASPTVRYNFISIGLFQPVILPTKFRVL